ncbi:RbsD/FucU domain-containing protein [Clostridium sp. AM58-1XD]|uniref:RbsD/FucU family protein n=1 Tax=Clostridium sp. AM58-1XD TaxID=2292307 RepID=UPI000E51899A|nr:RbsD/FucU domain-containing protein [Clostridium sp. AM58-1XD]RGY99615.1 fucose isomerase [Clostridium sp. AM58-1XD]
MLKGVPAVISPELLKVLHEMGHGDTLVIGDGNFPAASIAAADHHINIRCDGHRVTEMLDAILQLFPLDGFVEKPVTIMDKMEMHRDLECPVWDEFKDIVAKYDERGADAVGFTDRFSFYDVAKKAYAVVSTSETALYACIIIQKGCL